MEVDAIEGTVDHGFEFMSVLRLAAFGEPKSRFFRTEPRGLPQSFIETGTGDRVFTYPLAVESEWSIAGQTFEALRPGESREMELVSTKGARGWMADPMS